MQYSPLSPLRICACKPLDMIVLRSSRTPSSRRCYQIWRFLSTDLYIGYCDGVAQFHIGNIERYKLIHAEYHWSPRRNTYMHVSCSNGYTKISHNDNSRKLLTRETLRTLLEESVRSVHRPFLRDTIKKTPTALVFPFFGFCGTFRKMINSRLRNESRRTR